MATPRESHQTKTQEERRRYWQTVIRVSGPTLEDTTPIIDTTDSSAKIEREQIGSVTTKKTPSALVRFLKEKALEIVICLVLVPLFLWVLYVIYDLNREVGELKTTQTHLESQVNKVGIGVSEKIGALSSNVNRLEQRIDGLVDRRLDNRTKSDSKGQE